MYHVRYYNQVIHPDTFRKTGARGWVIVLLNWIRWRLETFVQYLTVKWLADHGALPKDKLRDIVRSFRLDVAEERLEKERTSPLYARVPVQDGPTREERYAAPTSKHVFDVTHAEATGKPLRPEPITNLIAILSSGRAKRYASRRGSHSGTTDDVFEALEKGNESELGSSRHDEVGGGARRSGGPRGGVPHGSGGDLPDMEG